MKFPIEVPAIKIEQPMATFFAVSLPAKVLLETCFSDHVQAIRTENGYDLQGTQRALNKIRLKEISEYIDRNDSAFPNSIILAANYHESGYSLNEYLEFKNSELSDSLNINNILESAEWTITEVRNPDNSLTFYTLTIPTPHKLAAIIDGQHRLFGFSKDHLKNSKRLDMELLCSVYIDLPKPYQAEIFATINSKQKQVDKSLTYDLYGYNISDEDLEYLSPDRLSVFFTRKLAILDDSPFFDRIKIKPYQFRKEEKSDWSISTAAVVEGIMRLFSTNPTKDTNFLLSDDKRKKRYSLVEDDRIDSSPLRDLYIDCEDKILFHVVLNFFKACKKVLWDIAPPDSFITKTVGIQALFDILKQISKDAVNKDEIDIRPIYFEELLKPANKINFADPLYKNASGSGRKKIREALEIALKINKKPE